MFAVKGWNVDATSLKPQTELFKSAAIQNGGEKQGRKRKRGGATSSQNDDVGQLWENHIEGKEPPAKKSKHLSKKEKKRKKLQEDNKNNPNNIPVVQKEQKSASVQEITAPGPGENDAPQERKKHERKKKDKQAGDGDQKGNAKVETPSKAMQDIAKTAPPKLPTAPAGAKLTPMQSAMRQKLVSARFRHLNQTLYTEPSEKALELFDTNPEMFEDYHSGFRQQVAVWPENPVDALIATIRERGSVTLPSQKRAFKEKKRPSNAAAGLETGDQRVPALPRTHGTAIIADLGCGDARLAQTLKESGEGQKLQLKVLSYDLHSPSPLVTKADISNIPTADGSVDIAIFCLALMGTNWISFIEEAYRILHWKGELWVAEIKSRFGRVGRAGKVVEHSVGGKRKQAAIKKAQDAKNRGAEETNEQEALAVAVDGVETANTETDVSAFVEVLNRRGFVLKNGDASIDLSNKMFVRMEFLKAAPATKGKNVQEQQAARTNQRFKKPKAKFLEEERDEVATDDEAKVLKPCLYKIR